MHLEKVRMRRLSHLPTYALRQSGVVIVGLLVSVDLLLTISSSYSLGLLLLYCL